LQGFRRKITTRRDGEFFGNRMLDLAKQIITETTFAVKKAETERDEGIDKNK